MKTSLIILLCILTISVSATAQSKLNNLLYKGAVLNSQLNNVAVKGDSTKSTLNKFKSLLGSKKDKPKKDDKKEISTPKADTAVAVNNAAPAPNATPVTTTPTSGNTLINITGIDFPSLQTLNENIKVCNGVQASNIKFSSDVSVITVNHTGTTADLWKLIELTSKNIVTSKNINGFEEGKISLKLK